MHETLYNGIQLPGDWPPRDQSPRSSTPMPVPYLADPPEVIPIDVGRQLFVDDFLVETSSFARKYHQPVKYPANPVFFPQTELERNAERPPATIPKCGGVWYDEAERCFKMWYIASFAGNLCYATSADGIHWERPDLDIVPGTNRVFAQDFRPGSGTVWMHQASSGITPRYKFMLRERNRPGEGKMPGMMMTSEDGIHWSEPVLTGNMDDRSTIFYNPFRRKWVHSNRAWMAPKYRCRRYWEGDEFPASGHWQPHEPVYWCGADSYDDGGESMPQIYNLDAVAYESVMLGFFQILKGPPNEVGRVHGMPKCTELTLATSRDGFHWHRPDRRAFIGADRRPGSWEYGYLESTGGLCVVIGDELWFYYSAYAGDPAWPPGDEPIKNGMYANGAAGLAKLRRDGFASLRACHAGAQVTTRCLRFSGNRLFVNANTAGASLRAECLEEGGEVVEGFSAEACRAFTGNSTCAEITWPGADLASLAGRVVRLRFTLDCGDLYAFWVTDSADGDSHGYLAAGCTGAASRAAINP